MTRRAGVVLALVAAVVSGVAVFINAYGVKAVGDATVYTTAKNLVAALLLGAVFAVSVGRRAPSARWAPRPPLTRAQLAGLVAMGIGGSVPFVLFFEGLLHASSVHAAFLHKTLVLWVALLAVPLLKERLTWAARGRDRAAGGRADRAGGRRHRVVRPRRGDDPRGDHPLGPGDGAGQVAARRACPRGPSA